MWRKISRRRSYSYTEFGTNEKGVSVSATETLYGNEKVTEADPYRDAEWAEANKSERIGIEETDIPTIILAEASSAREGVKLLLDIYENYGCVAASGVFVCDKDEVWYVENCSGTQYVAIKLNNNMIFLEPNMAVIGRVDLDDENVIASKDLIAVAKKAGTFVGDEAKNIIDFRASYARISEKMDQRMIDGLNYLNAAYKYDSDALVADNTKFTISDLDASDKLVALYTNIKADRKLDKDDVFGYYKLSSIGKASNQEIEIFQLFKDRPVETATVGWVGVSNMSYNVFVPYYPMLIDSMYKGYQVSTASAKFTTEKPDTFCTYGTSWAQDAEGNWQRVSGFKAYPSNWKDSYYFTFEGLGGYIANADKITGKPLKAEAKAYVADQLAALQQELYKDFVTTDQLAKADDARALATENGKTMAEKAHKLGVELVEYITKDEALQPSVFTDVKEGAYYVDTVNWAVDKKVTSGKTETTFAPNDSCTRAQAVTPLCVIKDGKDFHDGVDITPADIFAHVDGGGDLCSTSAVSQYEYGEMFARYANEYDAVVQITIGANFSCCYQNACAAAQEYENVFVVDSENLSTGQGLLVVAAAKLAEQGLSGAEIAERVRALAPKVEASFLIECLDYMRKGGRCSAVAALGANLLHLKPCIEVRNGKMAVCKKYRGSFEKCIRQYVKERLDGREDIAPELAFITHAAADANVVAAAKEEAAQYGSFETVEETQAGCTVSCHCGPNTLGILFVRK